jgi:hypothetical protein
LPRWAVRSIGAAGRATAEADSRGGESSLGWRVAFEPRSTWNPARLVINQHIDAPLFQDGTCVVSTFLIAHYLSATPRIPCALSSSSAI